jgi:hypothetical protein
VVEDDVHTMPDELLGENPNQLMYSRRVLLESFFRRIKTEHRCPDGIVIQQDRASIRHEPPGKRGLAGTGQTVEQVNGRHFLYQRLRSAARGGCQSRPSRVGGSEGLGGGIVWRGV